MRKLNFELNHALAAIAKTKENGVEWLYDSYPKPDGIKRKSTTGFLIYEGAAYPVKPLGRLAGEIAGSRIETNWETNVFRQHFRQLGFELVNSPEAEMAIAVERMRRLAEVWARPEQAKFRIAVLGLFGNRCLITGCESRDALEAAHILPVAAGGDDKAWNGISLRADLHRLFDADLITLEPDTWKIKVKEAVRKDYHDYHNKDVSDAINKTGHAKQLAAALRQRMTTSA